MEAVKSVKKTGRPRLGEQKKVRISINLTPDLLRKIEEDVDQGKGTSTSSYIFQIIKKYYS